VHYNSYHEVVTEQKQIHLTWVPRKRRSLVVEVWWRNRSGKKLHCKSKKTKKSEGKMLYNYNSICVTPNM